MKYEFIKELESEYTVKVLCKVMTVARSGYYAWKRCPVCKRDLANQSLGTKIDVVFVKFKKRYGSPRITAELQAMNEPCNEKRVARIMRLKGLQSLHKKKWKVQTTNSNHDLPIAPNLLKQNFVAEYPDQIWIGDITYIWTLDGWRYLATVLDIFSRQIVGWAYSDSMHRDLVIRAFENAVLRRNPKSGGIFHSDRGSQYASYDFSAVLKRHHFLKSMSGTGNCYDNAMMESFFHSLKMECIYPNGFRTASETKSSLFEYIEKFYNRERRHSSLGYLSPATFELNYYKAQKVA